MSRTNYFPSEWSSSSDEIEEAEFNDPDFHYIQSFPPDVFHDTELQDDKEKELLDEIIEDSGSEDEESEEESSRDESTSSQESTNTNPSPLDNFELYPIITHKITFANVKRKRNRKPYIPKKKLIFAPRVLRSDIRRQYMYMLINATNSGDNFHYGNFFRIYGNETPILQAQVFSPVAKSSKGETFVVQGPDQFTCFLAAMLNDIPDMHFHVENVQFFRRGGTLECRIECDYLLKGTFLSTQWDDENLQGLSDALNTLPVDSSPAKRQPVYEGEIYHEVVELAINNIHKPIKQCVVQKTDLNVKGRLIMYIDELKQITLIELKSSELS